MNLEDYRAVLLKDFQNSDIVYAVVLLNNKHSVTEFQEEINRIVREKMEEISLYGDDWEIVKANINEKYDWQELNMEHEGYLEI